MEEILDLYARPYDPAWPLVCMDEASRQLVAEVRVPLPMQAGQEARYDSEYQRNGTANIFMACEPLAGKRFTRVTERRTKTDWAHFIKYLLDEPYATAQGIRIVMDNLNTHAKASLYEAFSPAEAKRLADRLDIHHTPKHGSWLNVAEIELSHLSRQCLNRRIPDRQTFDREITAWTTRRNNDTAKISWQFTTVDARIKLKRLYPSIIY